MLIHKGDRYLDPGFDPDSGLESPPPIAATQNNNPPASELISGSIDRVSHKAGEKTSNSVGHRAKQRSWRSKLTHNKAKLATFGIATLVIASSFGAGYLFHKYEADQILLANLGNFNPAAVGRYIEALIRAPELPSLQVDMKFKHYKDLARTRETALQRGRILAEDKYFVPAKLRYAGQVIPVKMRFKGNGIDHLDSEKWSFRVHVKDDKQFLGMKRFSLHSPKTRNYLYEWVWLETCDGKGC
jgi:hypothetical protein